MNDIAKNEFNFYKLQEMFYLLNMDLYTFSQRLQNYNSTEEILNSLKEISDIMEYFLFIENDALDYQVPKPKGFDDLVSRFRGHITLMKNYTSGTDEAVKKMDCLFVINICVVLSEKLFFWQQEIATAISLSVQKQIQEGHKKIHDLNKRSFYVASVKEVVMNDAMSELEEEASLFDEEEEYSDECYYDSDQDNTIFNKVSEPVKNTVKNWITKNEPLTVVEVMKKIDFVQDSLKESDNEPNSLGTSRNKNISYERRTYDTPY